MKVTESANTPPRTRLPYWLPQQLVDSLWSARNLHIPKPHKKHFIELILNLSMDEYEKLGGFNGRLFKLYVAKERFRIDLWVETAIAARFRRLSDGHLPKTSRTNFLIFMLQWGLQLYEQKYTIYGFKKKHQNFAQ